jgi:integrating conjugative element protein (TIGR03757 family)
LTLAQNLPANADAAKTEALRRIGELNDARMAPAKDAAMGLAKAVQYGVDRYPAVVVNGTVVVYGVTELVDAAARYEAWRRGQSR